MDVEEAKTRRAYETVGELILLTSALEHQLNRILILALPLEDSVLLGSILASIEMTRKIEIIKARMIHISAPSWRSALKKHIDLLEKVVRARNNAAHGVMGYDSGKPILVSPSAAKIFKSLDMTKRELRKIEFEQLELAIKTGEAAITSGQNLIENFSRVELERQKRRTTALKH
jgi:hypothetical protein